MGGKGSGRYTKENPPGPNSNPMMMSKATNVDPKVNTKMIEFGVDLMRKLPPIPLSNPDDVENRLCEYFELCSEHDLRPLVSGLAMALGMSVDTLRDIRMGHNRPFGGLTPAGCEKIKRAYALLEVMYEGNLQEERAIPQSGFSSARTTSDTLILGRSSPAATMTIRRSKRARKWPTSTRTWSASRPASSTRSTMPSSMHPSTFCAAYMHIPAPKMHKRCGKTRGYIPLNA